MAIWKKFSSYILLELKHPVYIEGDIFQAIDIQLSIELQKEGATILQFRLRLEAIYSFWKHALVDAENVPNQTPSLRYFFRTYV